MQLILQLFWFLYWAKISNYIYPEIYHDLSLKFACENPVSHFKYIHPLTD